MSWSRVRLNRVQIKEIDESFLILRGHRIISWISVCITISWAFMILIALTTIFTEPLISIFLMLLFSGMHLFFALLMPLYSELFFDYDSQTVKIKEIFLFPFWIRRTYYKIPYISIRYMHTHLNEMHLIDDHDNQIELFFGFSRKKKKLIIELIEHQLDLTETTSRAKLSIREGSYLDTHFPLLANFCRRWDAWLNKQRKLLGLNHDEYSLMLVLIVIGIIIFFNFFPLSNILAFIKSMLP